MPPKRGGTVVHNLVGVAPPEDGALRIYVHPGQIEERLYLSVPTLSAAVYALRAVFDFDAYLWRHELQKPAGSLLYGLEVAKGGEFDEWTDTEGNLVEDYVTDEVSLSVETMDAATDLLERMPEELRFKVGALCLQSLARAERKANPITEAALTGKTDPRAVVRRAVKSADDDRDADFLGVVARYFVERADDDLLKRFVYFLETEGRPASERLTKGADE